MPKQETEPLLRIHVRVFESDYEWLKQNVGLEIGHNKALRYILRSYIKRVKARAELSSRSLDDEMLDEQSEMAGV